MEVADEAVDGGFAHVLHHHDVGEVAAEAVVVAVGEVVFAHEVVGGAAEKHGVAVFIVPAGPTDAAEFGHQIGCVVHNGGGLLGPAGDAHGLE